MDIRKQVTEDSVKLILKWNHSQFSQNYSIYHADFFISEINESVSLLEEGITPEIILEEYQYELKDWDPGTYYFTMVAFNRFFNCSSNCVGAEIEQTAEEEDTNSKDEGEPDPFNIEFPIYFVLFVVLLITLIYIKRKKG
jgi:hypothetical protein